MADKNIEIKLKGVRLSFLHAFEPQKFVDKDTGVVRWSYNTNILVPKKLEDGSKNPMVKVLSEAMKEVIEAKWPGQEKKIPTERRCVRDGEPIDQDTVDSDVPGSGSRYALYDGYEGHYYVSAAQAVESETSPNPVQLLGPKKTAKREDGTPCFPRIRKEDGLLYSGCWADVIIRVYAYDGTKNNYPNRVNASLEAIKFVRHGEAFSAKPIDADAAFDEEEDDEGFNGSGPAAASRPADDDGIG
ncbi:MAG TPA: ssDNA-binding protein [Caulobacteraceae bacterium]|jgi:hypothetical protein